MTRYKPQQGVTLIEMMIAMVVSLVLVAGIGTVYFSSKRNYQARDQYSIMDENARIALNSLKKHLEHAGYASNGVLPMTHPFLVGSQPTEIICNADNNDKYPNPGRKYYLTQNNAIPDSGTNVKDDGVGIAFLSDDNLFTDCSNSDVPAKCRLGKASSSEAALVYNSFSLDQGSSELRNSVNDLIPTLYCSGSAGSSKQMVAQGIERMELMYGIDADADGNVDQYQNADGVTSSSMWPNVISIKVGLLVRSLEPVLQASEAHTYEVLDNLVSTNDRYQRSVYTEVIHLRNRV